MVWITEATTSVLGGVFYANSSRASFAKIGDDWLGERLSPFRVSGWDGENATAISDRTIRGVKQFVDLMPRLVPPPDVAAGIDGSVGMVWEHSGVYLYVDVMEDGTCHYYYTLREQQPVERVVAGPFNAIAIYGEIRPAITEILRLVLEGVLEGSLDTVLRMSIHYANSRGDYRQQGLSNITNIGSHGRWFRGAPVIREQENRYSLAAI